MTSLPQEKSLALFQQASRVIPGGVNSPVRAFTSVGGNPVFITSAHGATLQDADNNTYVDLVCSWGPMIHGHAHPEITAAVNRAIKNGFSFGAPNETETLLAQTIIERCPAIDKVRLVNSGTEATMSAIRLARAVTGRDKILKFSGCYHGHGDSLLVSAGSGVATLGITASPGVPTSLAQETIVVPYNDRTAVQQAFSLHGDAIAAIITEAAAGNMGAVAPEPGFNQFLKDTCSTHGALFIIDEVMTGFRVGLNGWYGLEGVAGDIYTFGKVIGGGLPVAAFGGKAEIMNQLAPLGPVYQAGTLSGNPIAVTAGLNNLQLATPETYTQLDANAHAVGNIISAALRESGVVHHISYAGNLFSIIFSETPVKNFTDVQHSETWRYKAFFWTLLENGVYPPPSAFESWFVSTALTDQSLEIIESAAKKAAQKAAQTEAA